MHESDFYGLTSASQEEWERFVRFIVQSRTKNNFHSFLHENQESFHFVDHVKVADYEELMSEDFCSVTANKYLAVRFHGGRYLEHPFNKQFMNATTISSYAEAWLKEFKSKCWKDEAP